MNDEPTPEDAEALLVAAQETTRMIAERAQALAPGYVAATCLTIAETTHASIMAAMLLSQHGRKAVDAPNLDAMLDLARENLREFMGPFLRNGIAMIEAGEVPDVVEEEAS